MHFTIKCIIHYFYTINNKINSNFLNRFIKLFDLFLFFIYDICGIFMKTVIESFYESVEKFPDKIAISDKEGSYSYNELDEISTQIAGFILDYCKNQGINIEKNIEEGKNGERIAVIFPRRKIFLGILLGILKAGCCFINIDPGFPIARKNHIIHCE